jgi:hypothetical protein
MSSFNNLNDLCFLKNIPGRFFLGKKNAEYITKMIILTRKNTNRHKINIDM